MKKEIEVNENMLEGRNAVTEALKAGRTIDKVFLASGDTDSTLRYTFPAPSVQEGCGQFPVKGQDSHTEPAAHEGKGNALDAHARLPVV